MFQDLTPRFTADAQKSRAPVITNVSQLKGIVPMTTISVSEEVYTHEYLWRAAEVMAQESEQSEHNSLYFRIAALLLSYLAFEAFINFLGQLLFPEVWANEKDAFKGKGDIVEAKISKLMEKLTDFEWRKGEAPYQKIKLLKDFRDIVTHGKFVRSNYETILKEDGSYIKWQHKWDSFVQPPHVKEFMEAIRGFCQSLTLEARKSSDHLHLVFDAFDGPLGSAEGGPPSLRG